MVEKVFDPWRRRRVLLLVTFDVQGTFNSVHPAVLAQRLSERRVPASMVKCIRSFCEDRTRGGDSRGGEVCVREYTHPTC